MLEYCHRCMSPLSEEYECKKCRWLFCKNCTVAGGKYCIECFQKVREHICFVCGRPLSKDSFYYGLEREAVCLVCSKMESILVKHLMGIIDWTETILQVSDELGILAVREFLDHYEGYRVNKS